MISKIVVGLPRGLNDDVDLFVSVLGYERRAVHAASLLGSRARRKLAVAFPDSTQCSYAENRLFYDRSGFRKVDYERSSFLTWFKEELRAAASEPIGRGLSVSIDISSMSRPMIAQVVVALAETSVLNGSEVSFVYSPAAFEKPALTPVPIVVSQPVIPELAGWSEAPERAVSAIVGLGFEYEQALGALEFLEPAASWGFLPTGYDARYYQTVIQANRPLLQSIPREHLFEYSVQNPLSCFQALEGLVYGLVQDSRPVLLPFGPKIFALICMLVAQAHFPKVTVWRVSGEQEGEKIDREPSGQIIRLPVSFRPEEMREPATQLGAS